jgi:TRAP-type uncharacterized transport system substrate-binding protein
MRRAIMIMQITQRSTHGLCGARPFRRPLHGFPGFVLAILLAPLILCMAGQDVVAQPAPQRPLWSQQRVLQRKLNESALMILAGHPGSTYFAMAHDMATVLGRGDDLRLLTLDAAGGAENLRDLLLLRGVDLALVPANALADTSGSLGPDLPRRLTYITKLYGEEAHILVGPAIGSFENLRGKKVAVPPEDGNAEFTIRDVLRRLRVEADVVKMAAPDAIDEIRSGAFAALVLTGGKPLRFVSGLPKDGSVRLLALPFAQALEDGYSPSVFRSDDYPALIPEGQIVDTVSIDTVLMANNTVRSDESYRRIAKFVPALFGALSELAGPSWHPKWNEVNLASPLVGWSRFATAEEWLANAKQEQTAAMQKKFEEFLSAARVPGSPAPSPKERKELLDEFVKWTRKSVSSPNQAIRP